MLPPDQRSSGPSCWPNRRHPTPFVESDTTPFLAPDSDYNVGHSLLSLSEGSTMHKPPEKHRPTQEQRLVRVGLGLARWSERWFPDPLIFALLGIVETSAHSSRQDPGPHEQGAVPE